MDKRHSESQREVDQYLTQRIQPKVFNWRIIQLKKPPTLQKYSELMNVKTITMDMSDYIKQANER